MKLNKKKLNEYLLTTYNIVIVIMKEIITNCKTDSGPATTEEDDYPPKKF